MKTYLEYKDEKSHKFWETYTKSNNVITRYGKIGTVGKEITKSHLSNKISTLEMYKQIIIKRKKGYSTPNLLSMSQLLKYEKVTLTSVDDDLYYSLKGNYDSVIYINGNLNLEHLDLDLLHSYADGIIINGDLKVDGGIKNLEGDFGSFLIITGNLLADYVIGGGSEIYLEGESYIQTFTVGHYNHGILNLHGFSLFFIESDHSSHVKISKKSNTRFNLFDNDKHIEKFVNIDDKKASFVEIDENYDDTFYIDIDELNKHIIDTKKRLKLLSKLLK